MALTKISENGVKTDAITHTKLADDSVGSNELVASSTSSNRAVAAAHIQDEAVDEARLQVSNAGTNGQFLQKQSGNTGGLTWATVSVPDSDKIEEGNTSVETVDTGSDGHVSIKTEGTERVKVRVDGVVDIGGTGANTVNFNVKGTAGSGAGLTGNVGKVNIGSSYSSVPDSEGLALGQLIFGHGTNASGPIIEGSAGGTWSTNNLPSQLKFYTVPGSSVTQTERFRISKDGAFGIAGANYGASGQVLTSGGSSAAPSWAAIPPGGNTFTAVANGSIANNKTVKLDSDGKVSEVKEVLSAASETTFKNDVDGSGGNTTNDKGGRLIFDPDQDRLIYFYADTFADNNMRYNSIKLDSTTKIPVTSTSGTDGSNYGQSIESSTKHYPDGFEWGDVCYDTNNNKYIWAARDANTNNLYTKAGTYNTSDHTITWAAGSSNMQQPNGSGNAGRAASLYFDHTTNRIVLGYKDQETSPAGFPKVVIGTYNTGNGSIDWGTPVQLYDSVASDGDFEVAQAGSGTGKVVVVYRTGGDIRANLVTVSNSANSCTATTSQELRDNSVGTRVVYNSEDGNMIMISNDQDDSNKLKVTRLTINNAGDGLDVSSDTEVTDAAADNSYWQVHDLIYSVTSKHVWLTYKENNTTHIMTRKVSNTSGTPTLGSSFDAGDYTPNGNLLDDNSVFSLGCSAPTATNTGYIYCINGNNQDKPMLTTYQTHSSATNLTKTKDFVGFADQAYTNGQTATIKTYGNTVDTLSGLTIGQYYYLQGDGSIGTSTSFSTGSNRDLSTHQGYAGLAVSTSKLIISDPKA